MKIFKIILCLLVLASNVNANPMKNLLKASVLGGVSFGAWKIRKNIIGDTYKKYPKEYFDNVTEESLTIDHINNLDRVHCVRRKALPYDYLGVFTGTSAVCYLVKAIKLIKK